MNIVTWGDSITFGEGDNEALGWPGRMQKYLLNKGDYNVYNRGICGDTSEDALRRFEVEADSLEPNTILFAFGMNDCKFPNGSENTKVTLEDFKTNMTQLVSNARRHTEKIVLVGITEVNSEEIHSTSLFTNESIYEFDNMLRKIADDDNLPYIDMRSVIDIETDLSDGLHPNSAGYEKMFEKIINSQSLGLI